MKKQLFLLLILLAFTVLFAAPTGTVAADNEKHIYFTATSTSLCPQDPRCTFGEWTAQPNGKFIVKGFVDVVHFIAPDPRWTAVCVMTGDTFPPGSSNAYPIMGSFVCTPDDPAYAGGWWEGTITQVGQPDKWINTWRAKGYGTLDGLLTISRLSVSNINEVEIIELPGYQQ